MSSINDIPQEVLQPLIESLAQAGFNALTIALLHHTIRDDKESPDLINYDTLEKIMGTYGKVAEHHVAEINDKMLGLIEDEQLSKEIGELSISTIEMVKKQITTFVTNEEET